METKRGVFISFEGIEGCGKTTQIQRATAFLREQGIACLATKEPGGTRLGRQIRKIVLHADHTEMHPSCEALLYLADRAQHVHEVVKPALAEGKWVLCDRYHDSTLAYQGAARGISQTVLAPIFQLATGGLQPDLTLLLDLEEERGLQRANARNQADELALTEGRFEAEKLAFHHAVRQHYLHLAAAEPNRFAIIDARVSAPEVFVQIRETLRMRWMVNRV